MAGCGRKPERENGPTRLRGELDLALHRDGELARDREAEAAPGCAAARVAAVEALEDLDRCGLGDARAVVLDAERDAVAVPARAHEHVRARRRVAQGVLDERAADLEDPLLVAEARGAAVDAVPRQLVPRPLGVRAELLEQELGDLGEVDRIAVDTQAAGVEAGEVEQLAGELRQPIDLLAHAPEELAPGRVVELLLDEQLEMAAEREKRRPELVRGVGDELAAGVLEAREALAHAVERTRELAELVRARVDDRLVELAVRDPFGRALEATNPAREEPCAGIPE